MDGLLDDIRTAFSDFSWTNLLEVAVIALVLYAILRLLRGTTAMSIVRGIVIVVIVMTVFGRSIDSVVLNWIVDNALAVLVVVVLLVFQPEFRRAFEHVGRAGGVRTWLSRRDPYRDLIPMVGTVARELSQSRTGALIVIERQTGLEELARQAVRIGASPTRDLLMTIFWPGSPLHDGAVLLRPGEIVAAGVIVPTPPPDLAERHGPESGRAQHLGTRHRAAISISAETDALVVVVSEETGRISLAVGGELTAGLLSGELEQALSRHLHTPPDGTALPPARTSSPRGDPTAGA